VIEHDIVDPRTVADNGIFDNDIFDNGMFTDGGIGAYNDVFEHRIVGDKDRVIDYAARIGFCWYVAFEQNLVGGEQCFGFAAIIPAVNREGGEWFSLFNHELQCIGELVLSFGFDLAADQVINTRKERSCVLQKIETDNSKVADGSVRFFYQFQNFSFFGYSNAESPGVFNLFDSKCRNWALEHGLKIHIKNSVAENDEQRLIVYDERLAHPDGMGESEDLCLGDKGEFDAVMFHQPLFNHVTHIADNDNGFIDSCCNKLVHDVADNGLACYVEQYFGTGKGMGS